MAQLMHLMLLLSMFLTCSPKNGICSKKCIQSWTITNSCEPDKWVWKLKCDQRRQIPLKPMKPKSGMPEFSCDMCLENRSYTNNSFSLFLEAVKKKCLEATLDVSESCNSKRSSASGEKGNTPKKKKISVSSKECSAVYIQLKNTKTKHSIDTVGSCDKYTSTNLHFNQKAVSWIDALKHCHKENSSLVEIPVNGSVQDVITLLKNVTGLEKGVWIGLQRSVFGPANVEWQWISESKHKKKFWSNDFLVDKLNHHCGKIALVDEGKKIQFLDENCNDKLPFICRECLGATPDVSESRECEESSSASDNRTGNTSAGENKRPEDITLNTTKTKSTNLHFNQTAVSWIDALKHCRKENSSLVEIPVNGSVQDVITLLKNVTGLEKWVWIGLQRSIFGPANVEWQWISGSKPEQHFWSKRFPVDRLNHHCGKIALVEGGEKIEFLDENCHKTLPFICRDEI